MSTSKKINLEVFNHFYQEEKELENLAKIFGGRKILPSKNHCRCREYQLGAEVFVDFVAKPLSSGLSYAARLALTMFYVTLVSD